METPTKEQVLEAAKTSPQAKAALKKLFPTAFADDVFLDLGMLKLASEGAEQKIIFTPHSIIEAQGGDPKISTTTLIELRAYGPLRNKGFYLNTDHFHWSIERDTVTGHPESVLVPKKKNI